MFVLTSKDNANVKSTVKLKKSARARRESGLFIAEGVRVCYDAVLSNANVVNFFSTENAMKKHSEIFHKISEVADKTILVTPAVFAQISDTQSPQGFLCVIKTLDKISQFDTIKNSGKFLALENVQDPNNLGTVLRSAEAFAISGIIMSKDCCDIYNPKVVRGSMGAVFRLPFLICDTIKDFLYANPQITSFAAVVDSGAEKITDVQFDAPCVAVIGNEGNGLLQTTVDSCSQKITIPMTGKAESLNASVAASIIIWEMIK